MKLRNLIQSDKKSKVIVTLPYVEVQAHIKNLGTVYVLDTDHPAVVGGWLPNTFYIHKPIDGNDWVYNQVSDLPLVDTFRRTHIYESKYADCVHVGNESFSKFNLFQYIPFAELGHTPFYTTKHIDCTFGSELTVFNISRKDGELIQAVTIPMRTKDIVTVQCHMDNESFPIMASWASIEKDCIQICADVPVSRLHIRIERGNTERTVLNSMVYSGADEFDILV